MLNFKNENLSFGEAICLLEQGYLVQPEESNWTAQYLDMNMEGQILYVDETIMQKQVEAELHKYTDSKFKLYDPSLYENLLKDKELEAEWEQRLPKNCSCVSTKPRQESLKQTQPGEGKVSTKVAPLAYQAVRSNTDSILIPFKVRQYFPEQFKEISIAFGQISFGGDYGDLPQIRAALDYLVEELGGSKVDWD
jgi:hypothetical protein